MRAFLSLLIIFSLAGANAQVKTPIPFVLVDSYQNRFNSLFQDQLQFNPAPSQLTKRPDFHYVLKATNYFPGFFCKVEHKLEDKSKLAPRFRLGSLNYTRWMEGKGEFYSRYWR